MTDSATPQLVVGLGNPGDKYTNTRHNLGWWVIDKLAHDGDLSNITARKLPNSQNLFETVHTADYATQKVVLVKPKTYVNATGEAVRQLLRHYDATPADLIVVCDDMNLAVGRLRIRTGGGSGNHNGLRSVIDTLQTEDFARVRIGIGAPVGGATYWQKYVLQTIPKGERDILETATANARIAVKTIIAEGIEKAMNQFNAN